MGLECDGTKCVSTVLTHDVDGDGVLDVVAAGNDDNDVMWYANSRAAGLTDLNPAFAAYSFGLIPGPYDVAVVESGFGYADGGLAFVITDTGAGSELDTSYLVPLGSLTESWIQWTVTNDFPGGTESRLCPVDFNGDGRNDVAVASLPWSDLRVYIDTGAGNWEWVSVAGGAYTGITDVKCGDIDGDGRPDLVATSTQYFRGDRVSWWPNP